MGPQNYHHFPCIIWFDDHYNCTRYSPLKHDNTYTPNIWVPACLPWTLLSTGETALNKEPQGTSSPEERGKKTLLTKSHVRKDPICHANATDTRVTDVRSPSLLSVPDPERILVFACSALLPSQGSRESLSSPDLSRNCCASESREWL